MVVSNKNETMQKFCDAFLKAKQEIAKLEGLKGLELRDESKKILSSLENEIQKLIPENFKAILGEIFDFNSEFDKPIAKEGRHNFRLLLEKEISREKGPLHKDLSQILVSTLEKCGFASIDDFLKEADVFNKKVGIFQIGFINKNEEHLFLSTSFNNPNLKIAP